ncbi:MAG: acetyl-CoA carboxylase biotin carboxyl carrier protein [Candidatus Sumerlaeota bacterium]
MNLEELKELIEVMRKNKIREVNLDQDNSKVRIIAQHPPKKKTEQVSAPYPMPMPYYMPPQAGQGAPVSAAPQAQPTSPPSEAAAPVEEAPHVEQVEEQVSGTEITSPMVGTFYSAPSPDAPPYAEVGTVVNEDSVLCIIEAMKLMNEIKAEMRGKVVKVLVENGKPVEFGQPLFIVEPF